METPFQNDPAKTPETASRSASRQIVVSFVVILAGISAYFLLFRSPQRPAPHAASQTSFGAQEQGYVPNIVLNHFAMKQAENFLNQEIKILEGDIQNGGDKTILAIDGTIEFRDSLDQITLRETRPLLPNAPDGLRPGQTAHFEISFDHVPNSWNYQMPRLAVAGLKLTDTKK